VAAGIDPIEQKRELRAAQRLAEKKAATFDDALAAYVKAFANKGASTIELDALVRRHVAVLLPRPLTEITSSDVLNALGPVQQSFPKTAARTRAGISTVFGHALARDMFVGSNPASRDVFRYLMPAAPRTEHHRAMNYRDVPAFWLRLCAMQSASALALRLVILAGLRTGECLLLEWDECDLDQRLIIIPKERM
jgi:integrase